MSTNTEFGPGELDSGSSDPAVSSGSTTEIPIGTRHRRPRAVSIARAVGAGVVVAVIGVAVLAPSGGQTHGYRLVGQEQNVEAPVVPSSVAVPGVTLPGAVPAPPAGVGGAGIPTASTPLATTPLGSTPLGGAPPPTGGVPLATTPGTTAFPGAAPLPLQKPCSVGWPAPGPDQQGGLQSMIGIAPAFGPFSSEAFALGSVYQPVLQLAGPLLAEIEPLIAANSAFLTPVIAKVQAVEAIVLEAILPFYGPYRQQLLDSEVALGRILTPILQRFYASDVASCFVAWQAQIISRAKGKPIRVASLSRPGTILRLGPRP
ncbi:hypothetical protein QSJ18_10265 [Gordonia sp. ABSL1-1]|uniref:hypothetical protein n=1 Tax=Gordonia sp. ABSL1-1 TaxID=3053923 RepID=UPI0025728AE9|nr:hypothetical protein [Gordonia sp. ABSL1-1]MDL9937126.1 hypothetical protein [Gordonia sp. ABSL1-1]